MAAIGYVILQRRIIAANGGADSRLAKALGNDVKGKLSLVLYGSGVALAFVEPWMAIAVYIAVALMWLIPDRRIERTLAGQRDAKRSADEQRG